MARHVVGRIEDIPPGGRSIVDIGGRSIGVFNVGGRFFAIRNRCPHQGGPLCLGTLGGFVRPRFNGALRPEIEVDREGEIIRCPWHAWEFDLQSGDAVFGDGVRVAVYETDIEMGDTTGVPGPVETFQTSVKSGNVLVEVPD
jgi:3-phenylpropionate/trans-cinnamate dioxygenase ferredoxin subunit